MSLQVLCEGCGQQVPVPTGNGRRRLRCLNGGVYCDVPARTNEQILTSPEYDEHMYAAPEPLTEGADEDDGKPYRVISEDEPSERCPKCKKSIPHRSIICNHCGFNRETGVTLQRIHEEVDKQWESDFRFSLRFGAFLTVQGIAAALMFALVDTNWFSLAISWLVGGMVLAFIFGSYVRLNLARNTKGRVRLTKTWRICFIPLVASDLPWRDYEATVITQSHHAGFLDWLIVFLLVPWGIIPAILWWLYVVKADQYDVLMIKNHGSSELLLYRSRSQAAAREIADAIREFTGRP